MRELPGTGRVSPGLPRCRGRSGAGCRPARGSPGAVSPSAARRLAPPPPLASVHGLPLPAAGPGSAHPRRQRRSRLLSGGPSPRPARHGPGAAPRGGRFGRLSPCRAPARPARQARLGCESPLSRAPPQRRCHLKRGATLSADPPRGPPAARRPSGLARGVPAASPSSAARCGPRQSPAERGAARLGPTQAGSGSGPGPGGGR